VTDGIPLRIAEPAGRYRRSLRRYRISRETKCPVPDGYGYCNASADIGDVTSADPCGDDWPHDDPRWPAACAACGSAFTDQDRWQRNDDMIYQLPGAPEFVVRGGLGASAPPGTMIRAGWYDEYALRPGESWLVALPDGGEWITTQAATGGGYWEVTGVPPAISVSPSIWHNQPHGWHGWIRDGMLVDA
jgi:hypothetical protein